MTRRMVVRVLSLAVLMSFAPGTARGDERPQSANVTFRARIGNDLEAMTRLSPDVVAVLDGYDVVGIPVPRTPPGTNVRTTRFKLFDVRALPTGRVVPRGLAYDPGRELFYLGPATAGTRPEILVTDREGRPRTSITLELLPGQVTPVQFESLAYLPPGLPRFGDRIAAVLIGEDLVGRIAIVRLDGVVEYEIPVASGSPAEHYITGLAFLPPDRFLFTPLTETGSAVYEIDLAGSVTGPVLTGDPRLEFEGIAPLSGGRIAVVDYAAGWVFVHDATGARLAHQDRDIRIGAGISFADSLAWDSGAGRLLLNAWVGGGGVPRHVFALSPPFDRAVQVTRDEPAPLELLAGVAYLPDTGEVAVCEGAAGSPTRGVWVFDARSGGFQSRLALAPFPAADFRPRRVAPMPDGSLAMRVLQRPDLVQVFSREGSTDPVDPAVTVPALLSTITLAVPQPVGTSLDFDRAGGRLLVGRTYYDLSGNVAGQLTGIPRDFMGQNFTHLTSGPFAGQVAGFDGTASELVIFRP